MHVVLAMISYPVFKRLLIITLKIILSSIVRTLKVLIWRRKIDTIDLLVAMCLSGYVPRVVGWLSRSVCVRLCGQGFNLYDSVILPTTFYIKKHEED